MSDEKIDLAELTDLCELTTRPAVTPKELLALVRAVRAARMCALGRPPIDIHMTRDWLQLRAALAPFTDSAEDQS